MRSILTGLFKLTMTFAMVGHAASADAGIMASCGPMEGYSHYHSFPVDGSAPKARWNRGPLETVMIFLGTDKVEDVVLKGKLNGKDWTRSASDYGAPVIEVFQRETARHILIPWGSATELYALDTGKKTLSLVSQKDHLGVLKVVHAFVGTCE